MKGIYLKSVLLAMIVASSGCQDKPKQNIDQDVKQGTVATPKEASIPAIQAKVKPVKLVKSQVCQRAENEDDFDTCTDYDLQTIETNVDWINQYFTQLINTDYKEPLTNSPEVKVNLDPDMSSINESSASVRYLGQNYNIASFEYRTDYFPAGAAHGSYSTSYVVFDLAKKKNLKLDDILKTNVKFNLKQNLFSYNSEWLDAHNITLSDLKVSENFYFGANGLVFIYPLYELASYAEGESELTVPYSELRELLKPEYLPSLPVISEM